MKWNGSDQNEHEKLFLHRIINFANYKCDFYFHSAALSKVNSSATAGLKLVV